MKTRTLFDTRDWMNYTYEDYKMWCEDMDVTPMGENSSAFYDWAINENNECVECDWINLKYTKADKELMPFFVCGTLGTWQGRIDVHSKKIFFGISSAIQSAVYGVNDYKVYLENGIIYVEGYHHDGTDILEIHALSAKGVTAIQSAIDSYKIEDVNFDIKDYWFKKIKESDIWW